MGREIRKVIQNWQHPKIKRFNNIYFREEEVYQPLYDRAYIEAINEWIEEHNLWEINKHPSQIQYNYTKEEYPHYANYGGNPPDVDYYRPNWKDDEMTWFQVYETVSEGTPVTPPFATKEELVEYLVANGDFWDQKRRAEGNSFMNCEPWPRKQAENFVYGNGWAPSIIVDNEKVTSGIEALYGNKKS